MATQPDIADILDKAADLIAAPGKWTQHEFARDKLGGAYSDGDLGYREFPATCFCLFGAVAAVAEVSDPELYRDADRYLLTALGMVHISSVARWNDAPDRTQEQVVAKLHEAAGLARSQVQA